MKKGLVFPWFVSREKYQKIITKKKKKNDDQSDEYVAFNSENKVG